MAKPLIKPSRKNLLHKKLGVKPGEKIPDAKLEQAARSKSPAERKEADFAINFEHPALKEAEKAYHAENEKNRKSHVNRGK